MNGGSDTETESSDTENPSISKSHKNLEASADIFTAEKSEDDLEIELKATRYDSHTKIPPKMAISKNLPLLKNHFRKHWQERVRLHLDQVGKKASLRQTRASKAAGIAPRPLDSLRPVVRAPTIKNNRKVRAGRVFTLREIKTAGLTLAYARTIGIAVDHRRQNQPTVDQEEEPDAIANGVIRMKYVSIQKSANLELDHVGNRSVSVF